MIRYFSSFSGIGGFELGIERVFSNKQTATIKQNGQRRNRNFNKAKNNVRIRSIAPLCIGYSEIDKYAIQIYEKHFKGQKNYGDITKINTGTLPDFDLFVGGFPCQSFSIAGKRKGFEDTRGTLFFEIARILKDKRPRCFVLENVKGLLSHDEGNTFKTIIRILDELGYFVEWQVLNSKNFGVPQNRERVFIIGHFGGECKPKVFPVEERSEIVNERNKQKRTGRKQSRVTNALRGKGEMKTPMVSVRTFGTKSGERKPYLDNKTGTIAANPTSDNLPMVIDDFSPDRLRTFDNCPTLRGDRQGLKAAQCIHAEHHNTADVHYIPQDAKIRRLTPIECERLQGFPDGWTEYGIDDKGNEVIISDTQRYRCLGNAITTNVVAFIIHKLFNDSNRLEKMGQDVRSEQNI